MEKSNNQEVKEGKISPWRRMRNIQIPISCLLNATDNRTRQRLPKGWRDACKHWCCIEIQVLDRDRRRQFYQLHFHAMLVHLCAQLTLATVLVHATFHATVSHHTHHHLVIVKAVLFEFIITLLLCQELFLLSFLKKERRRRDLNPRAAINDLLPFQGSPFGQLGYFSKLP